MIQLADKSKCSGCSACMNICPVMAIEMEEDTEGFIYPEVDSDKCIGCGKCDKVCPYNDEYHKCPECNRLYVQEYYAGQLKEKAELFFVSSGGAFWAFTQVILDMGGVAYGAVQEDVDNVFHIRAENIDQAEKIRKSKYLPSNLNHCFQQAKKDLQEGRTVLFSGTGCQIAGLNGYLGKEYPSLFTCDVVCHGVPSLKAWRSYREEHESKVNKKIAGLVFRDKTAGWSKNQYKITYSDGSVSYERSTEQTFHAGYLQGLFYRPSCGQCPFASEPRVSDVTLADYWQYQGRLHSETKDIGVSLIAVNNEKGKDLVKKTEKYMEVELTSEEKAHSSCKHLDEHPTENPNRQPFMDMMLKDGYHAAAKKYINETKPGIIKRLYRKCKNLYKRN